MTLFNRTKVISTLSPSPLCDLCRGIPLNFFLKNHVSLNFFLKNRMYLNFFSEFYGSNVYLTEGLIGCL